MRKILVAVLLLAGCTSAPTPPPPAPAEPVPEVLEPITVDMQDSMHPRWPVGSGRGWRGGHVTLFVMLRNTTNEPRAVGDVLFSLAPEAGAFAAVDGENWRCEHTDDSATCTSDATVGPGELLPEIALRIPSTSESRPGPFTVNWGDESYEATLYYDTSV